MIKIKISQNENYINYIKVSGHANFDDYGKDIVCASVSSIVITSCNMALKLNDSSIKTLQKEGLIEVNVLIKDETIDKIFRNMIDMLNELSKQYKKNIKII